MPHNIDHISRLQWDRQGRCSYAVHKTRACEGTPGLSGGCQGTYRDDYGSYQSCPECHGRKIIDYWVYVRVPEFDAPRPKKAWVPDWIET